MALHIMTGANRRVGLRVLSSFALSKPQDRFVVCARTLGDLNLGEFSNVSFVEKDLSDLEFSFLRDLVFENCSIPIYFSHFSSIFEADEIGTDSFPKNYKSNVLLHQDVFALCVSEFVRAARGSAGCPLISALNILDRRVSVPETGFDSYLLSKVSASSQIDFLARACAPYVRVNSLALGASLPVGSESAAEFRARTSSFPFGRGASLEEIGGAVEFLHANNCITGCNLFTDMGQRWKG